MSWPGLSREQLHSFATVYDVAVRAAPGVAVMTNQNPDLLSAMTDVRMRQEFGDLLRKLGCPADQIEGEVESIVLRARTLAEQRTVLAESEAAGSA